MLRPDGRSRGSPGRSETQRQERRILLLRLSPENDGGRRRDVRSSRANEVSSTGAEVQRLLFTDLDRGAGTHRRTIAHRRRPVL